ncbi:MAG: hypothetical protein IIC36_15110 [Gemmatimonadetes bacterium]|nr:hypothetical protein [Gemmatimonadota bacterium]
MPPQIIDVIPAVMVLTTLGTIFLVGMKMRLSAKLQLQKGSKSEEVERLADAVDGLHEEVRMLREEYTELHERMDFAERMLSSGQPRRALGEQASTPS